MYKIFFNDRILILADSETEINIQAGGINYYFKNKTELENTVCRFTNSQEIKQLTILHNNLEKLFRNFSSLCVNIEASGGVVKNSNSEVLVIFRNGNWDLPKGKINHGESPEDAAIREISEECGIEGQSLLKKLTVTYHTYKENNIIFLKKTTWFEFYYDGKYELTPQTEEGISQAVWANCENLDFVFKNTYNSIKDVLNSAGIKEKL